MLWQVKMREGLCGIETVEADGCTVNGGALVFFDDDYSRIMSGRPDSRMVRIFGPGAYLEAWPMLQEAKPLEEGGDADATGTP